jgi:hypothetical protein
MRPDRISPEREFVSVQSRGGGNMCSRCSFSDVTLVVLAGWLLASPARSAPPAAIGSEFQVNTYTTGNDGANYGPAVAKDNSGRFVVVWESPAAQDGSASGIFGQRYSSSGGMVDTEFSGQHLYDPEPAESCRGHGRGW